MDSLIDILIKAGYFRAQASYLSDFDKIVGGMAWASQVLSKDVNIPILYNDSMDLGRKIALTEKLVMVLLMAECPQVIEPHQIVKLDHENLKPVLIWLMRKSSEVRKKHEAFNKLLAIRHFFRVTDVSFSRYDWHKVVPIADTISESPVKETVTSSKDDKSNLQIESLQTSPKNPIISFIKTVRLVSQSVVDIEAIQDDDDSEKENLNISTRELISDITDDKQVNEIEKSNIKTVEISADENLKADTDTLANKDIELDTELIATNQKILSLLRKLDSMPSQLEISQYQKRYIELHCALSSRSKDLKKLYSLYNTLDSTRHYMLKEIRLLESVNENLARTRMSISNQEDFLKQLQEIISKVQEVRSEVIVRLDSVRRRRDTLIATRGCCCSYEDNDRYSFNE